MSKEKKVFDMKELQNEAFWKGLRVIQSCENEEHIEVARRYADRFIELFCLNNKGTLLATSSIAHQYDTLQIALREQVKKLN